MYETEAGREHLLGDLMTDPDPLRRYHALTREQARHDALVSEIKRMRGQALAELRVGRTWGQVADLAGLGTRQRAEKLAAAGRQ